MINEQPQIETEQIKNEQPTQSESEWSIRWIIICPPYALYLRHGNSLGFYFFTIIWIFCLHAWSKQPEKDKEKNEGFGLSNLYSLFWLILFLFYGNWPDWIKSFLEL